MLNPPNVCLKIWSRPTFLGMRIIWSLATLTLGLSQRRWLFSPLRVTEFKICPAQLPALVSRCGPLVPFDHRTVELFGARIELRQPQFRLKNQKATLPERRDVERMLLAAPNLGHQLKLENWRSRQRRPVHSATVARQLKCVASHNRKGLIAAPLVARSPTTL